MSYTSPNRMLTPNIDYEVRFFATIGAIVSLSGALERTLFQFFEKASGMSPNQAASKYYQARGGEARRMTDLAMCRLLVEKPALAQWNALYRRLGNAAETTRYRNLVAHNPVQRDIHTPHGT